MFHVLPHILGIACLLYSVQLLNLLRLDLKGKKAADGLLAIFAGALSLVLTAAIIIGVDIFFPFDGTVSEAMYFIRMSVLIPLAYLAAFVASQLLRALIGASYPQNAVSHTAYFGVTLFFLAPIARTWFFLFIQK